MPKIPLNFVSFLLPGKKRSTRPCRGGGTAGGTMLLLCSICAIAGRSRLWASAIIGILASESKEPTGWGLHGSSEMAPCVRHLPLLGQGQCCRGMWKRQFLFLVCVVSETLSSLLWDHSLTDPTLRIKSGGTRSFSLGKGWGKASVVFSVRHTLSGVPIPSGCL